MTKRKTTRGRIVPRGRLTWRVSFRAGRDPVTGKPIRVEETVHGGKTDAEHRLTAMLREHDVTGLVPDRATTTAAFSTTWLAHVSHRVRGTTLKRYRELLEVHVVPIIGGTPLSELRPASVQVVIDRVLEHRSPRTAVNVFRVLSEMLEEGVRWSILPSNPARAIRPPRAPRPLLNIPDEQTMAAILLRVKDTELEGPVTLAAHTGMRLGELLGLKNKMVDLDRGTIRVNESLNYSRGEFTFTPPKTARARRVLDIGPTAVALLRRQRKAQAERRLACGEFWTDYDIVFDGIVGAPMAPWSVSNGFSRKVREMGLPPTRFHDVRHFHCSTLLARGENPVEVSARMGHSSVAFTMSVYGHLMPGRGRSAVDVIEEALSRRG